MMRAYSVPNPGAATLTFSFSFRVRLHSLTWTIGTSATAGNRRFRLLWQNAGGQQKGVFMLPADIIASSNVLVTLGEGLNQQSGGPATGLNMTGGLLAGLIAEVGDTFTIFDLNAVSANDRLTGITGLITGEDELY